MKLPDDPCPAQVGLQGADSYRVILQASTSEIATNSAEALLQRVIEKALHNLQRAEAHTPKGLSKKEKIGVFLTFLRRETRVLEAIAPTSFHRVFQFWLGDSQGFLSQDIWAQPGCPVVPSPVRVPKITGVYPKQGPRFNWDRFRAICASAITNVPPYIMPEEESETQTKVVGC